ncbi:MAG: lipoyl(octanoyl) transferase LipB [Dehalococcoidia bacterium]|nr:lipoyl(octanoyl) transferase LipB [Dehalococcoidia bacterium]
MSQPRVHLGLPGRLPYAHAHAHQAALRDRARESGESWLLLLEHDPVFTLGRAHPEPKLRAAMAVIEAEGIEVVPTERGGDITYHGPGQLVAYAILRLRDLGIGPTDLVWMLEECAIATAGEWGIEAGRDGRNRGAWVGDAKLASIGIHVRGGVSMHGMALNVRTNLDHFGLIEPCRAARGLDDEHGRPAR